MADNFEHLSSSRGPTAFQSLPIVDISGLYHDKPAERQATADALGRAAAEVGFLYITGHRVDPAVSAHLQAVTRAYFEQPQERKLANYIGHSVNHSGYVPIGEEQFEGGSYDLKEAYDIGFDYLSETGRKPMLGPNQWPEFPGFKEAVAGYYQAVFSLSRLLFRGFALALGLPEQRFEPLLRTPPSQLRLIHYPFNQAAGDDRPGIGAHTDYECFTILLPTAAGLEVRNGAGQWVDVPLIPETFVINIGDMLEVMSAGHFIATAHRVRKVNEERFSFPFFCACDYDTRIAPLAELDDVSGGRDYQAMICGEHLYAQTVQTFAYLKRRLAEGAIELPQGARALSSFGYGAAKESP